MAQLTFGYGDQWLETPPGVDREKVLTEADTAIKRLALRLGYELKIIRFDKNFSPPRVNVESASIVANYRVEHRLEQLFVAEWERRALMVLDQLETAGIRDTAAA